MTKRMLIDASHAEETRVVVLDGSRLEDFDVETSGKKQLKGNIYLAKVVRVEPSLQAAFVEYGGNRHGFLAFGEIHPDYYQIPVADRQRLIALQAEAARAEQAAEEALDAAAERSARERSAPPAERNAPQPRESAETGVADGSAEISEPSDHPVETIATHEAPIHEVTALEMAAGESAPLDMPELLSSDSGTANTVDREADIIAELSANGAESGVANHGPNGTTNGASIETVAADAPPESVGGEPDASDDARERRITMQYLRNYKIQEVIRRRQILLIQVVKEERGTKGAALTTYISLAGRFCVLMPNSPRGGGISRKITSAADRRRLKEITAELEIPDGMGMIVRTAGANRPKPEIKRDCEYLLRLWDDVREHTMRSVAPALIHEEASLIKRAIRDVYSRDIEEILVDGEEGWRAARDFMRMLMPSHAQKVIAWRDPTQPLFAKHAVEAQLDAMMGKNVQLRSGGYLVIDQTEALVSIDVNSGRSTRERGIEETALRTNLEAADEVARQLRLRDLAGLIVIDFIDMESKKHNSMVERRLQEALKVDRARIQVGHISHFGLMEMSRQRLRPSLMEASLVACPHCNGTGHVRSTESAAIHVLRGIEDEGARRRNAEIMVHVAAPIAMYILNHKRERLRMIEGRYGLRVLFNGDNTLIPAQMRIEKLRSLEPMEVAELIAGAPIAQTMPQNGASAPMTNGEARRAAEYDEVSARDRVRAAEALLADDAPDVIDALPTRAPTAFPTRSPAGSASLAPTPAASLAPATGSSTAASLVETAESRAEEENRRRRRRRRRGPRRDDDADGLSPVAALGAEQPDLMMLVEEQAAHSAASLISLGQESVVIEPVTEAAFSDVGAAAAPTAPAIDEEKALPPADAPLDVEPIAALETTETLPAPMVETVIAVQEPPATEVVAPEAVASPEVVASDEDSELKTRRRGRRGGRRRRRDDDEAPPEAEASAAPISAPVYVGPTPADPFGHQPFDIFDVMEQVEQAREAAVLEPKTAPAPPIAAAAEPAPAEAAAPPVPEVVTQAAPSLHLPSLHLVESSPDISPTPEPALGPAIKPVLIDAPAAERKRGWWRK